KGIFDQLDGLQTLHLGKNNITSVSKEMFEKLSKLGVIRLYENQLSIIPDEIFSNLTNLKEIALQGNKISVLPPKLFYNKPNLEKLYLEDNLLTELPHEIFMNLSALKTLRLQNNQLVTEVKNLDTLKLSHNNLKNLPKGIFDSISVKRVHLDKNPWNCDCKFIPLFQWMKLKKSIIYKFSSLKCTKDQLVCTMSTLPPTTTVSMFYTTLKTTPSVKLTSTIPAATTSIITQTSELPRLELETPDLFSSDFLLFHTILCSQHKPLYCSAYKTVYITHGSEAGRRSTHPAGSSAGRPSPSAL
uniref:LRRCT domain-containing protein n=1 Tax=Paramormyrops kingsleyae TaxID=1676925 RepID=A0A3B3RPF4_9TELE